MNALDPISIKLFYFLIYLKVDQYIMYIIIIRHKGARKVVFRGHGPFTVHRTANPV